MFLATIDIQNWMPKIFKDTFFQEFKARYQISRSKLVCNFIFIISWLPPPLLWIFVDLDFVFLWSSETSKYLAWPLSSTCPNWLATVSGSELFLRVVEEAKTSCLSGVCPQGYPDLYCSFGIVSSGQKLLTCSPRTRLTDRRFRMRTTSDHGCKICGLQSRIQDEPK